MRGSRSSLLAIALMLVTVFGKGFAHIAQVVDDDLMLILTNQENVIVVFTKKNCGPCKALEIVAEKAENKFGTYLNAPLVRMIDSQMLYVYNPTGEESIIFFRKGIPLLYVGDLNEESILSMFTENVLPVVKELTDENFEDLTQAATGSTTGDWFIFFTANDCHKCHRLYAIWEGVAAKLKHRLNVARVNRRDSGIATANRFGVKRSPEFIFIRNGKFYRYNSEDFSPKKFIEFAEGGYKENVAYDVPSIPGVLHQYMEKLIGLAWEHEHLIKYGVFGISLMSLIVFLAKYLFGRKPKPVKNNSKNSKNSNKKRN